MPHSSAPLTLPLTALALLAACSTAPAGTTERQVAGANGTDIVTTERTPAESIRNPAPTDARPTPAHTPVPADMVSRPAPSSAMPAESTLARIPARFVGTWAPDTRACTADYDYQPAFQRIVIKPDQIGFFETAGEVQAVAEAGGSTRITVRERVGDSTPVYPIMISLADNGRALNYIRDGKRLRYVKCAG